jgi:hypothetical protein
MLGRKVLVGSSGPSRGKPPGGENVPSARGIIMVERRRRPPTSTGGSVPPYEASGGPDGHWARRLPALHSLVSRGDGKRGTGGPAARKSEAAGQHSVGLLVTPKLAQRVKADRADLTPPKRSRLGFAKARTRRQRVHARLRRAMASEGGACVAEREGEPPGDG